MTQDLVCEREGARGGRGAPARTCYRMREKHLWDLTCCTERDSASCCQSKASWYVARRGESYLSCMPGQNRCNHPEPCEAMIVWIMHMHQKPELKQEGCDGFGGGRIMAAFVRPGAQTPSQHRGAAPPLTANQVFSSRFLQGSGTSSATLQPSLRLHLSRGPCLSPARGTAVLPFFCHFTTSTLREVNAHVT